MKIQSTNEQIRAYLKQQISDGVLVQGQSLNLNHIAEDIGVSVTPVRDAVNLLIYEGLIDKIGNKMYIHKIPEDEKKMLEEALITQIYTAFKLCIRLGLREKLITDLENALELQKNFGVNDLRNRTRAEITFDTTFVHCTGNRFLIRNLEKDFEYYDDLMYIAYHIHGEKQRLKSMEEHQQMIDLIKAEKDDELYPLLVKHYEDLVICEEQK